MKIQNLKKLKMKKMMKELMTKTKMKNKKWPRLAKILKMNNKNKHNL
jgi:hypothetical protein